MSSRPKRRSSQQSYAPSPLPTLSIITYTHRIITNNFLFDDITGTIVFKSDIKNVRINEKVACLKCMYAVRMQAQTIL